MGSWQGPEHWQQVLEAEFLRHVAWDFAGNETATVRGKRETAAEKRVEAETLLREMRRDALTLPVHMAHRELAIEMLDSGELPSYVAVCSLARQRPDLLKRLGGWETIQSLWLEMPMQVHYPELPQAEGCGMLLTQIARWLRSHAETSAASNAFAMAQVAVTRGEDPHAILAKLDELHMGDTQGEEVSIADLIGHAWIEKAGAIDAQTGKRAPIGTGFPDVDRVMGELAPGMLVIVGGRPGDGKSALLLAMLMRWARLGVEAVMISCEDPQSVAAKRVASAATESPQDTWEPHTPMPSANIGSRLNAETQRPDWKLGHMVFRPHAPIDEVLRCMTRAVRGEPKARALIIDYVQNIKGDHSVDRRHEIRRITAAIKSHGARLGVPVVLASQLKRRDGARPSMSDLRDAGELEEMAEVVLLLWRDESNQRFAVLAKAKSGPSGESYRVKFARSAAVVLDLEAIEPDQRGPRNGFGDE
jgi:hypothetical protein